VRQRHEGRLVRGSIDYPSNATRVREPITIRGWVFSRLGRIVTVHAYIDGKFVGSLSFGLNRLDVLAAAPDCPSAECGFEGLVSTIGITSGAASLLVVAVDSVGDEWRQSVDIEIAPPSGTSIVPNRPVLPIAFYLPQYHPIPENDAWWGKGFTEWTNVVRATPQFHGHEQPHQPSELGFYDLRVPEIREEQARLADEYGIFGFCYYYYWFGGRRLLERPVQEMLDSGSPNFPYCLCWANENWTRRWDGDEAELLLGQSHSPEDDENFIRSLYPYFSDPRYIRVEGRPVVLVYRPAILPNPAETARRWRLRSKRDGHADPYLVAVQSFGFGDPRPIGFDAAVEFPPHSIYANNITNQVASASDTFVGNVYDYADMATKAANRTTESYTLFRGVMPSWDNTPRRQSGAHIYFGSSPTIYRDWLAEIAAKAQVELPDDRRFVFINAWNEWGEGCHLEPDLSNGRSYLDATRDVVERTNGKAIGPLVSVVVPTYNRSELLAETLRTVLTQTYHRLELIVVNDGSTDDTAGVLEQIGKRRAGISVRVINKSNEGAHAALNDGIRAASGKYVAILNDDDRFHPERIMKMLWALEESRARFAFSRCAFIDRDGRPIGEDLPLATELRQKQAAIRSFRTLGYAFLDSNVAISTGNFFFEKSLFEEVGKFSDLKYCHDWDFVLRTLQYSEPLFVDEALYDYRIHVGNATESVKGLATIETAKVLRTFFAIDASLQSVPVTFPSESNFPDYHEEFIRARGYATYVAAREADRSTRSTTLR
jgi:glycosyltransferase involved in cell wall biosynthesis